MKFALLLIVGLLIVRCEDEQLISTQYIDIDVRRTGLRLTGYDGHIVTDWEINNTSDYTLNGWEILVKVSTHDFHQTVEGIFFRHAIRLAPDMTKEYTENVLFYWDGDYIYPITLTSSDTTVRRWLVLYARGVVF